MGISEGEPTPMLKLAPGRIDVIENRDRKEGEPEIWLRVMLLPEAKDKVVQAFFTKEEVLTGVGRVKENLEDIGKPGQPLTMLDRIQKFVNDLFERFK